MKIIQLVQRPQRRGAEIFAYQLSEALRVDNHLVKTIYLYPAHATKTLPLQKADHLLAGNEFHWMEKVPGVHLGLLKQLRHIVDDFDPDIIQVNGARTIKYGAFLKRWGGQASWSLIYRNIDNPSFWVNDRLRLWFYQYLVMPQVDGVIGVSQTTLDTVHDLYGIKVPSRYIPNGIDISALDKTSIRNLRAEIGISAEALITLFIGTLSKQKRPDLFVEVLAKLRKYYPTIQGWIVGDGPERTRVAQMIKTLGLEENVKLWGYQEQVGEFIAAADLLLVTSDSDGIPAVILEAGYLGKSVVARQVGGVAECVQDGKTGYLVDSNDATCFAAITLELLKDYDKRIDMGIIAKRWITEHFAIANVAQKYLAFYQQVKDS